MSAPRGRDSTCWPRAWLLKAADRDKGSLSRWGSGLGKVALGLQKTKGWARKSGRPPVVELPLEQGPSCPQPA